MSTVDISQDLWLEQMFDRTEAMREHAPNQAMEIHRYLEHGDYEEAEELLIKLENEVPLMLDGRENVTDPNY